MVDSQPDRASAAPGTPRWVKAFAIGGLIVALLALAVTVIAGGEHGPGRHTALSDAGSPSPSPGASVAVGVGGPGDADEATRRVEVAALDTLAFEPTTITVSTGEAVTFVVTNAGEAVHEFTLGDAAMQQSHAEAMAHMPEGMTHELPNSIRLEPGETRELTWRFGDAGTVEYACHEPGHYEAGMRGRIDVLGQEVPSTPTT